MKQYSTFFLPYFLFVLIFTVLILCNSKADLHLWMTSFNSLLGDGFFRYYTYVGDWIPFVVIAGLLFYKYRMALFMLASLLISGIFSVVLKQIFNAPRPLLYFSEHFPAIELHRIAGEHLHSANSFPSGHTITAFAFFMVLTFYTKKPSIHFLYFVLAALVGYSRIYLSQHFAIDVLVGSLIGVSITSIWKLYFDKIRIKWAEGSLRDVFLRKKG
ncbi:MAG: phosphatase PAP2 family protein [Paludibacter sp.]|nr:phosphatase PAP2 family protein [Paludibacter sp.]